MKPTQMVVIFVFYFAYFDAHVNGVSQTGKILKRPDLSDVHDCSVINNCVHSKKKTIPNCYCDDLCFVYGDCCADYPVLARNAKLHTHEHTEKINRTVCIPFSTTNTFDGIRAVDTCGPKFLSQDGDCQSAKVEKIDDLVLVTGRDGITYKNEYCAICNGIRDFEQWTAGISLSSCHLGRSWQKNKNDFGLKMAYDLYKAGCSFLQFPPNEYLPRYCLRTGFYLMFLNWNWTFVPVECLDNTMPISNSVDAFGSISCCVENFLYPSECSSRDFSCYESNEEDVTKAKAIGTKSMMVFFELRPSKVSILFRFRCRDILLQYMD